MLRLSLLVAAEFVLLIGTQAQVLVSDDEAIAHRERYVRPVYPAGQSGAHNVVMVKVHIAKDGSVTSAVATKGMAPLRPMAVAAVKQWHYRPFEEGAVVATIPVDFEENVPPAWLKQDDAVQARYFPADDQCRKAVRSTNQEEAVRKCDDALAIAKNFPDEQYRHLEILDAHELYGRALLQSHEPEGAEKEFDAAVALGSKYLKKSDAEFAYPFMWRAAALQTKGKIAAALSDYEESEASMRLALANIEGLRKEYAATLRGILRHHAALLRTQHEVTKAEPLEKEADILAVQFPPS